MEKIIDLHVHTNISDGKYSPKEVVDIAVKNGVKVLAIADHDTIDAYNDELFNYAKEKSLILIPAVEISTKINKCGIHVLGYNIDLTNKKFKETLKSFRNIRHSYLYGVANKLKKEGYKVNVEKLNEIDAVTKAHIAIDVVSNEDNKELLLKYFKHIPSKGEFIEAIMNEGCPCYVEKKSVTPLDAANLIRSASGHVVLAHPVAYKYEDNLKKEDILSLIKEMKIDAIEGNYIYIDRNDEEIDECLLWNEFAKENNLLSTIGSDFHDYDLLRPEIGLVNKKINLTEEEIDKILKYLNV